MTDRKDLTGAGTPEATGEHRARQVARSGGGTEAHPPQSSKPTLEQINATLAAVRFRDDVPQEQIALLWAAQADLTGRTLKAADLVFAMQITEERALDLMAMLSEQGLVEQA